MKETTKCEKPSYSLNISEKKPMSLVFLIVPVNETKNIWSGMNTFLVYFSICYIEFW